MRLLPLDELIQTSPVDHADWNYDRRLGWLQRRRFRLALSLLGASRSWRLLEVGYGSGVLMPELATRCDELHGIDPHPRASEVGEILARNGVRAALRSGSAADLPYDDATFDGIVSVSALEYVDDIEAGSAELARVLSPGGFLVVVTPGHSRLLDLALRVATGGEAAREYGDRRERLVPALLARFDVARERAFPPVLGRALPVYRALRLTPR